MAIKQIQISEKYHDKLKELVKIKRKKGERAFQGWYVEQLIEIEYERIKAKKI